MDHAGAAAGASDATVGFDTDAAIAARDLHHAYFTGLILTLVSRRSRQDAARWVFRVFRHQHHEKFLPGLAKLGLTGMPDAVACAAYHFLSNGIGGVAAEFTRESDRKAWITLVPPRWIYPGASICAVPSEVSRAMLRGWHAHNGVTLGNPRLGFVCTALTTDGQHGLSGYFLEHDGALAPEQRLQFRPGELAPPFAAEAAPRLGAAEWGPERLVKAERNYAMEYIRSGLPRLAEMLGPAEAAHLGRVAGRLVGAQLYRQTAALLGIASGGAAAFARYMVRLAAGEGDLATTTREGTAMLVRRTGWRLMRGLAPQPASVFEGFNGLLEGAIGVHDRFLILEVLLRGDLGDPCTLWRIRPRP
jgi:hypothetical protein